nr:Ppx/GppA phosphatase family protein [Nocardioides speluncae]
MGGHGARHQRLHVRPAGQLSTRVAAIDCGTNTIKLLIGELPEVAVRENRMVRLGQDVDRTGQLADAALERAFAAIDDYAALIAAHDVERIRFVATSATRDAANAAVFTDGVRARLGVEPEVVAGDEEARLAFDGAVRNLRVAAEPPVLVIDIGGGSTELILGSTGPDKEHSMDIGSVRLHERHLHSDPPTAAEIAAVVADIDAALDASPVDPTAATTVVGIAGTITTIAAGVLDLPAYDREAIDQQVLARADVHATTERLLALTHDGRRALPYMHPGRADVIGAGALILDRVLARTGVDRMVVSESDILDGIAWSIS